MIKYALQVHYAGIVVLSFILLQC